MRIGPVRPKNEGASCDFRVKGPSFGSSSIKHVFACFAKRMPLSIASGLIGGFAATALASNVVYASASSIVTLSFPTTYAPPIPKGPGCRSSVSSQVVGGATLYLETGKVIVSYTAAVNIYVDNRLIGPAGLPMNILFSLYDGNGNLLESLREDYVHGGTRQKVFSVDKQILLHTKSIRVSLSYA